LSAGDGGIHEIDTSATVRTRAVPLAKMQHFCSSCSESKGRIGLASGSRRARVGLASGSRRARVGLASGSRRARVGLAIHTYIHTYKHTYIHTCFCHSHSRSRGYVTKEVQVDWLKMSPQQAEMDEKKAHEIYADLIHLDKLPNVHPSFMRAEHWHSGGNVG
jgi:hypothetical protein